MAKPADSVPVLPVALSGQRLDWLTPAGRVSVYRAAPELGRAAVPGPIPILLLHSINASASAAEVAPLYEYYRRHRPVYALELPGYGFSDRSDRVYTPRLMTDALLSVLADIRSRHGGQPVDVLAVSLSCEYAARAQCEMPAAIRRLALVSPTGFSGSTRRYGPPGSDRGVPWLHRVLASPAWSEGIFKFLTRPGVIRYFLQRTWGSRQIDEALWAYDVLTTRQPGAKYAPLYFLSGFLFSNDINTLYESVNCPVWVSMASRGDFTDYRGRTTVEDRDNWQFHLLAGGALPYFETPDTFTAALDRFWL